jgi:hypothetical protein
MKKFYTSAKDPVTNLPAFYYNYYTTGLNTSLGLAEKVNDTITLAYNTIVKTCDPVRISGANFPATNPTRVLVDIPGNGEYNSTEAGRAWVIRRYRPSDATWQTLTRRNYNVTLSSNQYKSFPDSSELQAKIEIYAASVVEDDLIYFDICCTNSVLHEYEANALVKGVTQVVLANIDSDINSKLQADYIIDGDLSTKINSIITEYGGNIKISLLSGTYESNNPYPILMDQDNVEIEGIGFVKITGTANLYHLFIMEGTGNCIKNIEIDYITSSSTTGDPMSCIYIRSSATKIYINRVFISRWESTQNTIIYGIAGYIFSDCIIENCDISNIDSNAGSNAYAISLRDGTNVIINNNNIHELGDNTNQFGVYINTGCDNVTIKNNRIKDVDNDAIQLNSNGCDVVFNTTDNYSTKIVDNMGTGSINRIDYNL